MNVIQKFIEIKADVANAAKEIKTLFDDLLENQIKADKNQKQINDEIEKIGQSSKKAEKGIQSLANGFKGVGLALKSVGIGLFLEVFQTLKDVFSSNQKVLDFFSTGIKALTIAFNDLFNFIDSNSDGIVKTFKSIFQNPREAISKLGDAIKENLIERFNSFIDTIGYLGSTLKKLFTGDFSGAADEAKKAGKEMVDVYTGVNNTVDRSVDAFNDAVDAISEYTKETLDAAAAMVKLEKQVKIAQAVNKGLVEQYDRLAENQRQLRDDESSSIEDRIKANNKLKTVLDNQEKQMIKGADLAIKAAQIQYDQNKSVENYVNLINAKNEKLAILAQIEGLRSEQLENQNGLQEDLNELNQTSIDGTNERYISTLKFTAELEKTELGKLMKDKIRIAEEQRLALEDLNYKRTLYKKGTQGRADAEQEYLNKKLSLDQQSVLNDRAIQEERISLTNEVFLKEEEMRARELEARNLFEEAKFAVAQGGLDLVRSLADDSEGLAYAILALEKGFAAAQVIIEASKSIGIQTAASQAATKAQIASMSLTTPFPASVALAGAIAAKNAISLGKGIVTTKLSAGAALASILGATITGAKSIAGGASGGGGGEAGGAGAAPQAQFNIVGASGTNQLAATIGAQQNQTVNAYVVGTDVSTQQSLDRNRITNATFLVLLISFNLFSIFMI
jgi:hypothetical protein